MVRACGAIMIRRVPMASTSPRTDAYKFGTLILLRNSKNPSPRAVAHLLLLKALFLPDSRRQAQDTSGYDGKIIKPEPMDEDVEMTDSLSIPEAPYERRPAAGIAVVLVSSSYGGFLYEARGVCTPVIEGRANRRRSLQACRCRCSIPRILKEKAQLRDDARDEKQRLGPSLHADHVSYNYPAHRPFSASRINMPTEHDHHGPASYLPTSLDFINLPNPIQPAPQLQRHPLNGTPHLEKARLENGSNQDRDLFKLILQSPSERPSKRQKSSTENPQLDLPKLPARHNAKRHRLPPTLSGLHQPPPDSGLLPSINTEQPEIPPPRLIESSNQKKPTDEPALAPPLIATASEEQPSSQKSNPKTERGRTKRTRWSDDETRCLLKGVEQFGIGSWTKILNCPEYTFNNRTALDLKDRFRVCCPDSYKRTKMPNYAKNRRSDSEASNVPIRGPAQRTTTTAEETGIEAVSSATREKYGVSEPFKKTERRSRTGWSKAEDEALFRGFKKYGNEWAAMRDDPGLGLGHRQRADLRGRMRTRYPREYGKPGLGTKKAEKSAASGTTQDEAANEVGVAEEFPTLVSTTFSETILSKTVPAPLKAAESKRPPQPRLFSLDDLYLGPFGIDDDDVDNERIVLDRGILDWVPNDTSRPSISASVADGNRSHGINPQMTLKLPKPNPIIIPSSSSSSNNNATTTSLPALATLLPPETVDPDQLELPPLSQWYDEGTRTAGMTLEEILS
ncbi:uncharacterized protein MYCFIDRAFT_206490 [Pseudocercospora fijiensis CIRAD86]|uniref:Myb-like domain-containing protein n=1 Tax=Pseudocercospora fijiensis (strain CIRAD86) TaxID=383855 RepID=M3ALA2_PSEFD|nr:uncharacterized protein MYCFIDRAFT_206490 [Pseudocercospora fijiensis CIRAD86]EME85356.1 hypothetical protein MYCFIDRAFT_206490 [Pseudocercospora fijiensis CIRAD86]